MSRVFISYKHGSRDGEIANRIHKAVGVHGHDSFIDQKIPGGVDFTAHIEEKLKWCDAFIIVISQAAISSTWVFEELHTAQDLRKEFGNPRILPVQVEKVKFSMAWNLILRPLQRVKLDSSNSFDETLEEIINLLGDINIDDEGSISQKRSENALNIGDTSSSETLSSIVDLLSGAESNIREFNFEHVMPLLEPCSKLLATIPSPPPSLLIRTHNAYAITLAYKNELDEALDHIEQGGKLLGEIDDIQLKAWHSHRAGFVFLRRAEFFDALKYLENAESWARAIEDLDLLSQIESIIGQAWQQLGMVEVAIEFFHSSLTHKQTVGDERGIAIEHGNLGRAYQQIGRLEEARTHFKLDLDCSIELGDRNGAMMMRSHLAEILAQEGRFKQSLEDYQCYMNLAKSDRLEQHIAFANLGMGRMMVSLKEFEVAEQHLEAAKEFKSKWFEPLVLSEFARLYCERREHEEARYLYEACIESFEENKGRPQDLVKALCGHATVCKALGQDQRAEISLDRATTVAKQSRMRWLLGGIAIVSRNLINSDSSAWLSDCLPMPLAIAADQVERAQTPNERLYSLVDLFKAQLRYCASVVISQYISARRDGLGSESIDETLLQLFYSGPPSLGKWAQALRTVAMHLAPDLEGIPLSDATKIFVQPVRSHHRLCARIQDAISELLAIRNQLSHVIRATGPLAENLLESAELHISEFSKSIAPIGNFRLAAMQNRDGKMRLREMTGSLSAVSWPEVPMIDDLDFPEGTVLICDHDAVGAYINLSPWFVVRWRADPDERGDLFRFSKRGVSKDIYFNIENGEELRLPKSNILERP